MSLNKVIGNRIKALRRAKGLDQEGFCKAFEDFRYGKPLPTTTLSSWETGKKKPKVEQLIELAFFFDTSVDFLIGRIGTTKFDNLPSDMPGRRKGSHNKKKNAKEAV